MDFVSLAVRRHQLGYDCVRATDTGCCRAPPQFTLASSCAYVLSRPCSTGATRVCDLVAFRWLNLLLTPRPCSRVGLKLLGGKCEKLGDELQHLTSTRASMYFVIVRMLITLNPQGRRGATPRTTSWIAPTFSSERARCAATARYATMHSPVAKTVHLGSEKEGEDRETCRRNGREYGLFLEEQKEQDREVSSSRRRRLRSRRSRTARRVVATVANTDPRPAKLS